MWAQNNVWAHVGIFVSGLMKLRPENLYLNRSDRQYAEKLRFGFMHGGKTFALL